MRKGLLIILLIFLTSNSGHAMPSIPSGDWTVEIGGRKFGVSRTESRKIVGTALMGGDGNFTFHITFGYKRSPESGLYWRLTEFQAKIAATVIVGAVTITLFCVNRSAKHRKTKKGVSKH